MARPSLARRLGAASLLTTLVLTSASCGGDDDATATDESSSSETSDSPADGADEDSSASSDLEELSADEFYPSVMAALQDAGSMAFSITTTGGADASEITGVMEYDDDEIAMQGSSTGASTMEMVMLDKVLYLSGDGLPLTDGKKWLKVDMSDPDSLFGQLGRSTDPTLMLKAMETPTTFELLGTEEVDGVETNHYNVVMDSAAYIDALDMPDELATFMPKEFGIEMWVDADNLPRKFHQELEIPDMTGSGEPTRSTTDGTYSDFGTDVDIEAPPAAEVADNLPGMG